MKGLIVNRGMIDRFFCNNKPQGLKTKKFRTYVDFKSVF